MRFENRFAIIAGAASDIGKDVARTFGVLILSVALAIPVIALIAMLYAWWSL